MKKNKSLMITSSIMIAVISIMLVYVILISTGVIVAKKHTIRIEAVDASKEYDGAPLTLSEYRIVEGQDILDKRNHEVIVGFVGNQVDAGTSQGELIVSVFDSSGADVTKRYNIEVVGGSLTVTPRLIKMRSQSIEKEYDGTPLTIDDIIGNVYEQVTGSAVIGQEIKFVPSGSLTEIGSTYIDIAMEITDSNNLPVNPANYQIIYEDEEDHGKITITPRYITVKTFDMVTNYDGQDHGSSSVEWDANDNSIAPGDRVVYVKPTTSAVDAGEYLIDSFDIKVVNSAGVDVSRYYGADPKSQFGKLVIKPIELTLVTDTMSKEYDGVTLDPSVGTNYQVRNWIQAPSGDSYQVEFANKLDGVGEVDNEAIITIRNAKNEDVTHNYVVTNEFGKLIVTQRAITIKTFSASHDFNGQTIYGSQVVNENGDNYEITIGTLAPNHTLKIELNAKITSGGQVKNEVSKIYILDENKNDVTENYLVTKDEGTLEINKVMISVITASQEWTYDGLEHSAEEANIEGVPDECRVVWYDYPKITDATYDPLKDSVYTVPNKPKYIIYDKNNNVIYDKSSGITSNFEILSEIWGELTVLPLEITVTTQDKVMDYNGSTCFNHVYETVGLVDGHFTSVSWPNDISEVQKSVTGEVIGVENKPKITIFDSKSHDITNNYRIKGNYGELKINPLAILVSSNSIIKTYDGTPIVVSDADYTIDDSNLVPGHHISNIATVSNYVNVIMKSQEVGSKDNEISFVVMDTNGTIVTKNYDVVYVQKGILQINPIYVTLNTATATIVYDGEEHIFNEDYSIDATDEFLANIGYNVTGFKSFVNANTSGYINECKVSFYPLDHPEETMGYNVKVINNFGKIYINKLTVNVATGSGEKVYDGTPLINDEITISDEDLEKLAEYGITPVFGETTPITNVYRLGSSKTVSSIDNKTVVTFKKDNVDISKNIEVVYTYGKLKIIPIDITVQTEGTKDKEGKILSKEYDGTPLKDEDIFFPVTSREVLEEFGATYVIDKTTNITDVKRTGDKIEKIKNDVTIKLFIGGIDVTDNFEIAYDTGYLRIDPIQVTGYAEETRLQPDATLVHEYDNTDVTAKTIYFNNIDSEKLENAGIDVIEVVNWTIAHDVKWQSKSAVAVNNELEVKFYKDGVDITKNVLVINNFGKIKINPVAITVYTEQTSQIGSKILSKPYDGEELFDKEPRLFGTDQDKLDALNAEIVVDFYTSIKDVTAPTANKIDCKIIDKTTGYDYTSNFDIDYQTGKLEITGVKITIKSGSGEFTYDGEGHSVSSFTIPEQEKLASEGYIITVTPKNVPEFVDVAYDTKLEVTSYKNEFDYDILVMRNSVDVTSSIDVKFEPGKITIKPWTILISLNGATKTFDNKPLTQLDWSYVTAAQQDYIENTLHQTLNITVNGSQTLVGQSANTFEFELLDSESNNVSGNYSVVNNSSKTGKDLLIVKPLVITAISNSDSKIFEEGQPLTCEELLSVTPALPEGFTYTALFSGSQEEIGYSENKFVLTIMDPQGNDASQTFNDCFDVNYKYGKLEVLPYVTGTGNLAGQQATPSNEIDSFTVIASDEGIVYLKDRAYGDYIGTGWSYATPYEDDTYDYNGSMILSKVLDDNSFPTRSITIDINSNMPYLVPYYSVYRFEGVSTDDTHITYAHGNAAYTRDYYNYSYNLDNDTYQLSDPDYIAFEAKYYEYVLATYLNIDDNLGKKLRNIAKEDYNITKSDNNLVYEIAEYIMNYYSYGSSEGRKNSSDIIAYFLETGEGTCQDFASLAVMMYRAFEIPARFVTGFAFNVPLDKVGQELKVKQTSAHAWVEVYIAGMGWVDIEVTNGNPMNISDGGPVGDNSKGSHESGDMNQEGSDPTGDIILQVYSDQAGILYLRSESFGDYKGNGFAKVDDSDCYTGVAVNPLNYPARVLQSKNYNPSSITIKATGYTSYAVPYYPKNDFSSYDDVYVDGIYGSKYTIDFINYNVDPDDYPRLTGALALAEDDYYDWVCDHYLSLAGASSDLLAYFASEGFSKLTPPTIEQVATYIQNAATYTLHYSQFPNECTDYVYYFLHDSKEGVCAEYAAAATLLYRYVGIPARYTTGIKCAINKNEVNSWVEIDDSSCHAWVEVYLKGFGWIPVEVTGFGGSSDGDGMGSNNNSDVTEVTIQPQPYKVKYHDGMEPVELTDIYLDEDLENQGFYVVGEINIDGDSTHMGLYRTYITSYAIYDKYDSDVTGQFAIKLADSSLHVYYEQITITTIGQVKEYDGTPAECEEIEPIDYSKIKSGHTFHPENIIFTNSGQIDIGESANSFSYVNLITDDETGLDVTDEYDIHPETGMLQVIARKVTITAGSLDLDYDDYLDSGLDKYYYDECEVTSGTLLPGHVIYQVNMNPESYLSDEGDDHWWVTNIINSVVIHDAFGNNVTAKYKITVENGELTLN